MRVYDLFCGAGGASEGLRQVGLEPVGFDFDADACASHAANGDMTVRADLDSWPWRGTCDLLWASPPCQPFSSAGKQLGAGDGRDGMPAFLRAVEELRPPIVLMENVAGFAQRKFLAQRGAMLTDLARLGYVYEWRILDAADFGVAQHRKRFILIARRDGERIRWPKPTHNATGRGLPKWVGIDEALGWGDDKPYPTLAPGKDTGARVGHSAAREALGARLVGFPRTTPAELATGRAWGQRAGGDCQAVSIDEPSPSVTHQTESWWLRPATTIAGDNRLHPPGHKVNADDIARGRGGLDRAGSEAVRLTEAEGATLQGFPPGYVFCGRSKSSRWKQIGNAVCPPVVAALASAVLVV